MNINTCCVCDNKMSNTYSLKINKDDNTYHTCGYNCNQNVCKIIGEDYWKYVVNKSDFIIPSMNYKKKEFSKEFNFDEHETEIIQDPERYNNQYEIYLENKRIDEIMDNYSDKSSSYSEDDY